MAHCLTPVSPLPSICPVRFNLSKTFPSLWTLFISAALSWFWPYVFFLMPLTTLCLITLFRYSQYATVEAYDCGLRFPSHSWFDFAAFTAMREDGYHMAIMQSLQTQNSIEYPRGLRFMFHEFASSNEMITFLMKMCHYDSPHCRNLSVSSLTSVMTWRYFFEFSPYKIVILMLRARIYEYAILKYMNYKNFHFTAGFQLFSKISSLFHGLHAQPYLQSDSCYWSCWIILLDGLFYFDAIDPECFILH